MACRELLGIKPTPKTRTEKLKAFFSSAQSKTTSWNSSFNNWVERQFLKYIADKSQVEALGHHVQASLIICFACTLLNLLYPSFLSLLFMLSLLDYETEHAGLIIHLYTNGRVNEQVIKSALQAFRQIELVCASLAFISILIDLGSLLSMILNALLVVLVLVVAISTLAGVSTAKVTQTATAKETDLSGKAKAE